MIGCQVVAWLRLLRISNLPTVWSNALAGYVLGWWIVGSERDGATAQRGVSSLLETVQGSGALLAAFSLIYVGGMAMNDVMDAPVDARVRLERPIPAGLIARRAAAGVMVAMLVGGLALLEAHRRFISASHDPWVVVGGVVLVAAVTAYNALHLRMKWSVLLMATCRGLVILTAGVAVDWPFAYHFGWAVAALALAIAGYTLCISVVARGEDEAGPGRKHVVMGMIAGMPMVDAVAMGMIGQWSVAGFCVGCAVMALMGQRWVAGT